MAPWFLDLVIDLLDVAVVLIVALVLTCWGLWGDRSKGRPRCPKCWADMRGALPRLECPECGYDAKERKRLYQNRRGRLRIVFGAVLLLLVVMFFIPHVVPRAAPPQPLTFWYDMKAGELYGGYALGLPPEVAPSGGEGVMAMVYAEKDCADANDRFVLYLWKYTPESLEWILNPEPGGESGPQRSVYYDILVKTPDEDEWVLRRMGGVRHELIAEAEAQRGVKLIRCLEYE